MTIAITGVLSDLGLTPYNDDYIEQIPSVSDTIGLLHTAVRNYTSGVDKAQQN
jgi:hypothetical protein